MDIDFSPLWSWTLPIWGLILLVFALGTAMTEPPVLYGVHVGGARSPKNLRSR